MARLTTIGQNLIAAAVGNGPKLTISKFVFANIPGLDHTAPEPVDEPMPLLANIVFSRAPTKAGLLDENRVTYSQMMLTDVGDFSFNWIGLVYTDPVAGDQLVMFAYVPLTQKIKTQGASAGNVLTRNMVIEHLGIANATPVVVSAESWMFDIGGELANITLRLNNIENTLPDLASAIDANASQIAINKQVSTDNTIQRVYKETGATVLQRNSKQTIFQWDAVAAGSVAIEASSFVLGDRIEITNLKDNGGTLTISNQHGLINVPNGTSENSHTLTGRGTVIMYKLSADNDDLTITSIHK